PELQLTQEYLGQGTHLVYEAPLFSELLLSDTYEKGKGATVARIIEGKQEGHKLTGMAGVSNIGNDRNWTHHPFAQANWYALRRMCSDPSLHAATIATDWIAQTFTHDSLARQ